MHVYSVNSMFPWKKKASLYNTLFLRGFCIIASTVAFPIRIKYIVHKTDHGGNNKPLLLANILGTPVGALLWD